VLKEALTLLVRALVAPFSTHMLALYPSFFTWLPEVGALVAFIKLAHKAEVGYALVLDILRLWSRLLVELAYSSLIH
jgi:hypothetical protein